ncbi:flagellar motor switch protein FliG [Sphingosinicella ginsenosidimutans]|uniref:Flagellar motor switch protein FliG n=1 Tax=Allosphingosinicella ginsenosidimutans TaxID=1176539 RepID=A0A5C6TU44_9SPHN|nr:flagellar motor switch protein FliG [Sphingosinicella ginsenosidimutans]TXC63796.1 flagellar motor switch protein FliG [Sphingosinicella ginsenosidimutans]
MEAVDTAALGANSAPIDPNGSEAAAILLMLLGDNEAAEILSHLEPYEVQHLGSAMFGVADVTEDQVESVFHTFLEKTRARTTIGFGAAPRIRAVMEHALGAERAGNVLARITPPTRSRALEALRWMDAKTIAALIEQEHPQIAALVVAHLEPPIAADVLQLLPSEMQPDVIYRVARLESVTPEALEELERILVREVGRVSFSSSAPTRGGASEAAKIMNNMRSGQEQRIIRTLGKIDKNLAQRIEDEMFIFEDLMDLDEKNLGILLRNVDNEVLIVALKGADERLKDKMFGCMSSRAADSIKDEMEARGPMRLAEVQDAQKEVLAMARRLADAGTIMLAGRGEDYV